MSYRVYSSFHGPQGPKCFRQHQPSKYAFKKPEFSEIFLNFHFILYLLQYPKSPPPYILPESIFKTSVVWCLHILPFAGSLSLPLSPYETSTDTEPLRVRAQTRLASQSRASLLAQLFLITWSLSNLNMFLSYHLIRIYMHIKMWPIWYSTLV